jgi:7-cyano-7-deazaguanine reductase
MADNPLGKAIATPDRYAPEILLPIPRADNRGILGIDEKNLPFHGADVWNAYELSCLDPKGKPVAMVGRLILPADSPCIVESKSMKLYFNSLNMESYNGLEAITGIIRKDLSEAAGAPVEVMLALSQNLPLPDQPTGVCLDDQDMEVRHYTLDVSILAEAPDAPFVEVTEEVLYTNAFRSNCPITNQPDWATVTISYHGRKLPHAEVLEYLVSYRQHNDYHENCVERIFRDLMAAFEPQSLTVEANFLRRGGLDINPIRTTESALNFAAFPRFNRQ